MIEVTCPEYKTGCWTCPGGRPGCWEDIEQLFFVENVGNFRWSENKGRGPTHDCLELTIYRSHRIVGVRRVERTGWVHLRYDPTCGTYDGWIITRPCTPGVNPEWIREVLGWLRTHPIQAIKNMGHREGCSDGNCWMLLDMWAKSHPEYHPLPIAADQLALEVGC